MNVIRHITTIQGLFDGWRELGSCLLPSGVELFGSMPVDAGSQWMHSVFPGCTAATLDAIDHNIGTPMPSALRAFYRNCGGMSLFLGAFQLCMHRTPGQPIGDAALEPADIVALNHELDALGWRPGHAVAFALNSWDLSVHVAGMHPGSDVVLRCERSTGKVMETHANVFECLADRLYRFDQLLLT